MKIIISPALNMSDDNCFTEPETEPVYIKKAVKLANYLKSLGFEELQALLSCSYEIAKLNYERYRSMDLNSGLLPAILSFSGIQYKYMAPQVFEDSHFIYIKKNLRILSGLYGILRPFDGIRPYRLEMLCKLKTPFCRNLYDYWKDDIYKELVKEDNLIINLASNEYRRAIEKYLTGNIKYLTCTFGFNNNGKVKEKTVYSKMARGAMVRYMAENNIEEPNRIKEFNQLGFRFSKELSSEDNYVFLRE